MREENEVWCLEVSLKQRCFHKDLLSRSINSNITSFLDLAENDWSIIGIGNNDEINNLADKLRYKLFELREKAAS